MKRLPVLIVLVVFACGCGGSGGGGQQPDPIVGTWQMYAWSDTMEGARYALPEGLSGSLTFRRAGGFTAVLHVNGDSTVSFTGQWQQITAGEYLVIYSGDFAGQRETYYLVAGNVCVLGYYGQESSWFWCQRV